MIISLIQLIKYSIASGLIMSVFGTILQIIGFTNLDIGTYLGCLLTGKKSGKASFFSGFATHLIASVVIAYLYLQAINYFNLGLSLQTALMLGLANTLFSGIMIRVFDMISPCVASKKLQPIGFFASEYGIQGIVTYALIHIVFAITFFAFLGAPLYF